MATPAATASGEEIQRKDGVKVRQRGAAAVRGRAETGRRRPARASRAIRGPAVRAARIRHHVLAGIEEVGVLLPQVGRCVALQGGRPARPLTEPFPQPTCAARGARTCPTALRRSFFTCTARSTSPCAVSRRGEASRRRPRAARSRWPPAGAEVSEFPFELKETGWGEFDLVFRVLFRSPGIPPVDIMHRLKLYPPEGTSSTKKVRAAAAAHGAVCDNGRLAH